MASVTQQNDGVNRPKTDAELPQANPDPKPTTTPTHKRQKTESREAQEKKNTMSSNTSLRAPPVARKVAPTAARAGAISCAPTPQTSFFEKACEDYPATMMSMEGWTQTKGAPSQRLGEGQAPQSHIGLGPSYGRPHICGHAKTRFSGQTKNAKNEVRT